MANLTQMEFDTIRELVGPALTGRSKFADYAQQAENPQIRKMFEQLQQGCDQKLNSLIKMM